MDVVEVFTSDVSDKGGGKGTFVVAVVVVVVVEVVVVAAAAFAMARAVPRLNRASLGMDTSLFF